MVCCEAEGERERKRKRKKEDERWMDRLGGSAFSLTVERVASVPYRLFI